MTISEGVTFLSNQKPYLSMTNILKFDRRVLWLVKFGDYFYIADDKGKYQLCQQTRVFCVYENMNNWKNTDGTVWL